MIIMILIFSNLGCVKKKNRGTSLRNSLARVITEEGRICKNTSTIQPFITRRIAL